MQPVNVRSEQFRSAKILRECIFLIQIKRSSKEVGHLIVSNLESQRGQVFRQIKTDI